MEGCGRNRRKQCDEEKPTCPQIEISRSSIFDQRGAAFPRMGPVAGTDTEEFEIPLPPQNPFIKPIPAPDITGG